MKAIPHLQGITQTEVTLAWKNIQKEIDTIQTPSVRNYHGWDGFSEVLYAWANHRFINPQPPEKDLFDFPHTPNAVPSLSVVNVSDFTDCCVLTSLCVPRASPPFHLDVQLLAWLHSFFCTLLVEIESDDEDDDDVILTGTNLYPDGLDLPASQKGI